jgi:hypothetical protein
VASEPLFVAMREAADTLEQVSRLYDYLNPDYAQWSAKTLRHEAEIMEAHQ